MKIRRKIFLLAAASAVMMFPTQAFALTSDFNYTFKTENNDEFYNTGQSTLNFNGNIPDYLYDIYDFTPQTVNTSDFGSTIITPGQQSQTPTTNAPYYAPVGGYQASPTLNTGAVQGANSAAYSGNSGNTAPVTGNANVTSGNFEYNPNMSGSQQSYGDDEELQYPLTTIEKVRNSDGSIGNLSIPKIGLNVTAYDGDTFTAMKKGIGHIASTSAWSGTIGLVGHNRGTSDYFGKLKNLSAGDELIYKTNLGTRTYAVENVVRISETDWSYLQYTSNNRLVLITCVEDVPSQRLCVIASEKR